MAYEKSIYLDSHENYQDGNDRDHPKFTFNEQIYGFGFYLKRLAFINSFPNVAGDIKLNITIEYTLFDDFGDQIGAENNFINLKGRSINLPFLVDQMNYLIDNTQQYWIDRYAYIFSNFRNEVGKIGITPITSSDVDTNTTFGIRYKFFFQYDNYSTINHSSLNDIRSMFGEKPIDKDTANSNIFNWFNSDDYIPTSRTLRKGMNKQLSETSAYAKEIKKYKPFDSLLPKYLFLHSNLSQFFIARNQLKIGNRQTYKQNDVIAVIPVSTEEIGERLVWEEKDTVDMASSIQTMTMNDINNLEFWFTMRGADGEELPVTFNGRTFQLLIKYWTNQI